LFYNHAELIVAAGIGVYIVGVTWFARTEATDSARFPLLAATIVMALGIVLLATLPDFLPPRTLLFAASYFWPLLLAMLFLTILRGALTAVADPIPPRVQAVIKHAIMSLILFDAAITMAMRGAVPALCVLALLVPMQLLGRWVYST
jgi:4-hydroxybenzoate polyprenyltransferase